MVFFFLFFLARSFTWNPVQGSTIYYCATFFFFFCKLPFFFFWSKNFRKFVFSFVPIWLRVCFFFYIIRPFFFLHPFFTPRTLRSLRLRTFDLFLFVRRRWVRTRWTCSCCRWNGYCPWCPHSKGESNHRYRTINRSANRDKPPYLLRWIWRRTLWIDHCEDCWRRMRWYRICNHPMTTMKSSCILQQAVRFRHVRHW